jgi:hypothetical protein
MEHDEPTPEQILENYEKQFENTAGAEKIVAAQSLMNNKIHAVTSELLMLALHAEKEETRLKACLAVQKRVMGPENYEAGDPADKMFQMLEAKSARRDRQRKPDPQGNHTGDDEVDRT